jgi:hypothetical protein
MLLFCQQAETRSVEDIEVLMTGEAIVAADDFRSAILAIERRFHASDAFFLQTHETLIAELMTHKRELLGSAAAARYESGLVSLLAKETQDCRRFASEVERYVRQNAALQRKISVSEAKARETRERLEAEIDQLRAARAKDAEVFEAKLKSSADKAEASRQVLSRLAGAVRCFGWTARETLQDFRERLADVRDTISADYEAPLLTSKMQSMIRLHLEERSSTFAKEPVASTDSRGGVPSRTAVGLKASAMSIDNPSGGIEGRKLRSASLIPQTDWKPELHDLLDKSLRALKGSRTSTDAATQCCEPALHHRDMSAQTVQAEAVLQPIAAPPATFSGNPRVTPSAALPSPPLGRLADQVLTTMESSIPPTAASSPDEDIEVPLAPPIRIELQSAGSAPDRAATADSFFRRHCVRQAMVRWLRRLKKRQQQRLGMFLKDRVAAVLGLSLRPELVVPQLKCIVPRLPSASSARARPISARNTVPLETFEEVRAAVTATKSVDMSVALMTTNKPKGFRVL